MSKNSQNKSYVSDLFFGKEVTMLSTRANVYLTEPEFLVKSFIKCMIDPTIINMGTAVNALCEDILQDRFSKVKEV